MKEASGRADRTAAAADDRAAAAAAVDTAGRPWDDVALVVFDWDGTLVDTIDGIAVSMQRAAADLGLAVPDDERARHVIGLGLQAALRHAVPDLTAERQPAFLERYRHHFVALGATDRPFDGARDLLAALSRQGRRLAVATGKSRAGLDRAFAQTGLGTFFEASRCADEGFPKPHPWMLQALSAQTGVGSERIAMVGDTSHDIAMAAAFGARSIGVGYGAHTTTALTRAAPDRLVHTIADLAAVFGVALAGGTRAAGTDGGPP